MKLLFVPFLIVLALSSCENSNTIPENFTRVNMYSTINTEKEFLAVEQYFDQGRIIREEYKPKPGDDFHSSTIFHYNKNKLLEKKIQTLNDPPTKMVFTTSYIYNSKGKLIEQSFTSEAGTTKTIFHYNKKGLLVEEHFFKDGRSPSTEFYTYKYDRNDSLSLKIHSIAGALYTEKYIRKGNNVIVEHYSYGQKTDQFTYVYENGMMIDFLQQKKDQIGTSNFRQKSHAQYVGKHIVSMEVEEYNSFSTPKKKKRVFRYEYLK